MTEVEKTGEVIWSSPEKTQSVYLGLFILFFKKKFFFKWIMPSVPFTIRLFYFIFFSFTCLTLGIHAQLWQLVLFSKHLNISLSTFRQELTVFSGSQVGLLSSFLPSRRSVCASKLHSWVVTWALHCLVTTSVILFYYLPHVYSTLWSIWPLWWRGTRSSSLHLLTHHLLAFSPSSGRFRLLLKEPWGWCWGVQVFQPRLLFLFSPPLSAPPSLPVSSASSFGFLQRLEWS